jgi:hypothetical protein
LTPEQRIIMVFFSLCSSSEWDHIAVVRRAAYDSSFARSADALSTRIRYVHARILDSFKYRLASRHEDLLARALQNDGNRAVRGDFDAAREVLEVNAFGIKLQSLRRRSKIREHPVRAATVNMRARRQRGQDVGDIDRGTIRLVAEVTDQLSLTQGC